MYFETCAWSLTSNSRFSMFTSIEKSMYVYVLLSTGFILIDVSLVLMYCFASLRSLLMYTFFHTAVICLDIAFLQVLMNHSATTDFPLLRVKQISVSLFFNHNSLIYCKIHCLFQPTLCLVNDLNKLSYLP